MMMFTLHRHVQICIIAVQDRLQWTGTECRYVSMHSVNGHLEQKRTPNYFTLLLQRNFYLTQTSTKIGSCMTLKGIFIVSIGQKKTNHVNTPCQHSLKTYFQWYQDWRHWQRTCTTFQYNHQACPPSWLPRTSTADMTDTALILLSSQAPTQETALYTNCTQNTRK